ncbi:MAG: zinc-ribbon domain-containing protein [Acidobacteriota bacterium]|nr:zinc-ribbon domain-containing protein [Acidobacteriota bacterium]
MILVCENCSTSLQLDEKKAPSGKFSVRCPKCKSLVSVNVGVGNHNSTENGAAESAANNKPAQAAAQYKMPPEGKNSASPTAGGSEDLMRLLAGLLNQKSGGFDNSRTEPETSVLLCLPPDQRERTAQLLSENGWQLFVAESPTQALETLSEIKIGNVVLAANFAPEQRGAQTLQNHFSSLMPAVRRNIFLVYLDERPQTSNPHEAFLRNQNLVVNVRDLPNLPQILRRERRDFDEAYRFYKNALANV